MDNSQDSFETVVVQDTEEELALLETINEVDLSEEIMPPAPSPSVEKTATTKLKIGDQFSSFEEFMTKFLKYCEERNLKYHRHDNRLVTTINDRMKPGSLPYKENLVYTSILFVCGHYGEKVNIVRRIADRQCKSMIKLTAKVRDKLDIVSFTEEHTHLTNQPQAKVFPMRNFARGPLPYYIYHGKGLQTHRQLVNRDRVRCRKPRGRPRKVRGYVEPSMPTSSRANDSTALEQYFPPLGEPNRTESSSSAKSMSNQNEGQTKNTSKIVNALPSSLKDLSGLTENTSRMNADDLFFLSMSSEIQHLPRNVKHNIKMKIMSVVHNHISK
ncbi:uncharacterized protein LOC144421910 [Styela clava]